MFECPSRCARVLVALLALSVASSNGIAQERGQITGRVIVRATAEPVRDATVSVEGTTVRALTDSLGVYRLRSVPAGRHVLRIQRLGFGLQRIDVVVPDAGTLTQNVELARSALEIGGVRVLADPAGRARGELGTASVIESEAIRSQVAASLAGVLELVPGIPLSPPGLDNVQQVSLRTSPVSGGSNILTDANAENIAAFGTLLVLDGVPLSNNANLQSLGTRGELSFSSAAGGGIDLRRIPATTIERVEVIRGIPSARWGDLTHGAIIVDTRAGAVEPALAARADANTTEFTLVGGREFARRHALTLTSNAATTRSAGVRDDASLRVAGQLAHRYTGGDATGGTTALLSPRLTLDSRIDFFRLTDDQPEVENLPGSARYSTSSALRVLERAELRLSESNRLMLTAAYERGEQQSWSRRNLVSGIRALSTRLEPGREVGRFGGGTYNTRVDIDGAPSFFYVRSEMASTRNLLGLEHDVRLGAELRRESNSGEGTQFDLLLPPQAQPNGARGFDRPRRYAEIPAFATTGLYIDDRFDVQLFGSARAMVQAGVRVDMLHDGGQWLSATRDAVWQPRLNAELALTPNLSLRAGAGRLAKSPSMASLNPSPDYYDVVNVNYFANEPAERLAVLTTFVLDPSNPDLGYTISDRVEGGVELRAGGSQLSLTVYYDKLTGATSAAPEGSAVTRELFDLENVNPGSGQPPRIVEPPIGADVIPVLISRSANNTSQSGGGVELIADFPEIRPLRTRVSVQGAFARSSLFKDGLEFPSRFQDFQLLPAIQRIPYYQGIERTGERLLLTTRLIHHQPELGLVLTGIVQHTLREVQQNVGATDSLAFAGYMSRDGSLTPVPLAERGRAEYSDLRIARSILTDERRGDADWLFSLQVAKTLPRGGRLSFYAFNALDRQGQFGTLEGLQRLYASSRFGLEVTMPLAGLGLVR